MEEGEEKGGGMREKRGWDVELGLNDLYENTYIIKMCLGGGPGAPGPGKIVSAEARARFPDQMHGGPKAEAQRRSKIIGNLERDCGDEG